MLFRSIYVGQSQDIVVRRCHAERNVAGIEIENSLRADVYENQAVNNTGGIMVFDLPGLNLKNGGYVRIFNNRVESNNHKNFAQPGAIVGEVPPGTGVMLMATDHVEIFDNDITGNQTSNIAIVSYLVTERKLNDKGYDPYPESFYIHDNRIGDGGKKPSGKFGKMLAPILGVPFPDILYDGIVDAKKFVQGELPEELQGKIMESDAVSFANVRLDKFSPANLLSGKYTVDRDRKPFAKQGHRLDPVVIETDRSLENAIEPAVLVYRKAPLLLSAWGMLQIDHGKWTAASGTIPYELNTPLYSDDTIKHRWIRLPEGKKIE